MIAQIKAKRRRMRNDDRYGYGRKDAAVAAKRLAAKVKGEQERRQRKAAAGGSK